MKMSASQQMKRILLQPDYIPNLLKKMREERKRDPEEVLQFARQKQAAKKLRKQLQNKKKAFSQRVKKYQHSMRRTFVFKQPLLQILSDQVEKFMHQSQEQVKALQKDTIENQKITQAQGKWLNHNMKVLDLQREDEQQQIWFFQEHASACCQYFEECIRILNGIIDDREERKAKVQQFLRKIRRPAISIKTRQPVLKKPQYLPDSSRPQVEFIPENKELIFNIWTFEGQIVQFILFFDPDSKKFGLKNPSKTFQSQDLNAVRAFNFHKNVPEFYEQLCLLVTQFIDDVDDLPVYEGK